MAVRLKDIAEKTGINIGSVSHVLNNHYKAGELRPETRKLILETANMLGYHRNELARSVAIGSSKIIAFISSDMGAIEYTGRIQKNVFETASKLGYSVSFYQLTADNQKEILRNILEWKIAGIIFHTEVEERKLIMQTIQEHNIPIGIINHASNNSYCIGVTSDDFQGSVAAVKYLTGLGHHRITYVTTLGACEFLRNRSNGYLEGMKRFASSEKPQIINIESDDYDLWCREDKLIKLLNTSDFNRPTAFFCAMDSLAMAFCRAAYLHGKKIPEDFSVVGFGNLEFATYSIIPLTTISQPFEEMSQVVTTKVIKAIDNKKIKSENIKLNTELIIRQSTAILTNQKH